MGANNFAFYNVDRAYEFCMPYEVEVERTDLEGNYYLEDVYVHPDYLDEIEILNESLLSYLKELGFNYTPEKDRTYQDNDRNYPALKLGEYITGFEYFGYDIDLTVILIARGGYSEGMCLDFTCEWEGNDIFDQDRGYMEFDLENFVEPQDIKKVKRRFFERLEKEGNKIKTIINTMYAKHTS